MSITYSGVDWVTMTSTKDSAGAAWWEMYCKYKRDCLKEELREKPYNNGYYAGIGIGSMRWGFNEKRGYICIIQGRDANDLWKKAKPPNNRVTRLDLCFDFLVPTPQNLAKVMYHNIEHEDLKKNRKYALYQAGEDGSTLYVGSRHSQQYGRLYDKGAQLGTERTGSLWRAEVEYKKPMAGLVAEAVEKTDGQGRAEMIAKSVSDWFQKRSINLNQVVNSSLPFDIRVGKKITTKSKKMAWLRTQVAPTVQELIHAGHGSEALLSLGLDALIIDKILEPAI